MRIFTAYCCRPRDWQPSWAKPMSPQATRRRLRNCEQRLMPIFLTPAPGLYNVNTGQPGVADQQGNAYAVLYGVAPAPRTNLVALLQNLTTALYRTPTAPNATGPVPVQQSSGSTQVGPYTSAYELFARFETGDTADALALIRNEWGLMRRSSPYYSGATWEYVGLDGTPGLREGTSLAHGWGSGPTSALSKYVLGIRPVPVFCPSRSHLPAFLCSTGITPFLRSYEGSVTFRVRFFGPSAGHERRSFPEWRSLIHVAPTSCHSITTHPMHSFSCAHCLAAGRGRRSCLALHGSASGSGLRSFYASSPMHQAVSCSTLFYLWTGSSSPVASHPVSRRRSYLRLRTASVLSDGDFHPIVGAHSQAHVEPQPGGLSWAAGTVPNTLRAHRGQLADDLPGPAPAALGTEGTLSTVGLPVGGANAILSDNGRTVAAVNASRQPSGRAGYLYLQNLQPGAHLIQITRK